MPRLCFRPRCIPPVTYVLMEVRTADMTFERHRLEKNGWTVPAPIVIEAQEDRTHLKRADNREKNSAGIDVAELFSVLHQRAGHWSLTDELIVTVSHHASFVRLP